MRLHGTTEPSEKDDGDIDEAEEEEEEAETDGDVESPQFDRGHHRRFGEHSQARFIRLPKHRFASKARIERRASRHRLGSNSGLKVALKKAPYLCDSGTLIKEPTSSDPEPVATISEPAGHH